MLSADSVISFALFAVCFSIWIWYCQLSTRSSRLQFFWGGCSSCLFYDDSERDGSEERHDSTKNPLLEMCMLPGCSPALQQWMREEEICLVAVSCQFALNVIFKYVPELKGVTAEDELLSPVVDADGYGSSTKVTPLRS